MKKPFDAVETMRCLREAVGKELDGKSFEEQRRYIDERVKLQQEEKVRSEERRKTV